MREGIVKSASESPGQPRIATKRLTLKPLSQTDAPALFEYRSDALAMRFQQFHPESVDDAQRFIANSIGHFNVGNEWYQFGVFHGETLIGDIGVHFLGPRNTVCEIGYTIHPAYQGRGYAREAVSRLIDFLFRELDKSLIVAVVDPQNGPSIGLLQRLGFSVQSDAPEGAAVPECAAYEVCYELRREDWSPTQPKL